MGNIQEWVVCDAPHIRCTKTHTGKSKVVRKIGSEGTNNDTGKCCILNIKVLIYKLWHYVAKLIIIIN